jgi:3-dehydroquinate synthetase
MRLIAHAMLILGFVWICFCQFEIRPIMRIVGVTQAGKIPKQESYKSQDVVAAVHDTAVEMADRIPSFYIGALIMLGGGVILDMATRRKRVSQ